MPSLFGCTASDLRFFFRMYSWRLTRRGGFGPSKRRPPLPISVAASGVEITSSSTLSRASSLCKSSRDTPSTSHASTSMSSAFTSACGTGGAADSMTAEVSGAAATGSAWPTCSLLGDDGGGWGPVECFNEDCFDGDWLDGDSLPRAATVWEA